MTAPQRDGKLGKTQTSVGAGFGSVGIYKRGLVSQTLLSKESSRYSIGL